MDLHREVSIEANGELALGVTYDVSFDSDLELVKLTDKDYGTMGYVNVSALACHTQY